MNKVMIGMKNKCCKLFLVGMISNQFKFVINCAIKFHTQSSESWFSIQIGRKRTIQLINENIQKWNTVILLWYYSNIKIGDFQEVWTLRYKAPARFTKKSFQLYENDNLTDISNPESLVSFCREYVNKPLTALLKNWSP